jgi:hypothetical protein
VGKSEGSEAGEAVGVAGEANPVEDVEEAEGPTIITAKNPHAKSHSPLQALQDD